MRTNDSKLLEEQVRELLREALHLGGRADRLSSDSPLLGALPELDSMAVVHLITAIEERFGIFVDDDEVNAATFATFHSLVAFVSSKQAL
jgi:acyl carrier protein